MTHDDEKTAPIPASEPLLLLAGMIEKRNAYLKSGRNMDPYLEDLFSIFELDAAQLRAQAVELARLRGALEWYAGAQNWSALDGDWAVVSSQVRLDQGKRARAALADAEASQ
ncbi:hypothetical protein Q0M94_03535 [Deinococcus radiomollis]|uniref:hypothetical protein n=1 Tax=Deinococcus radiomollis TaxID=468916 RepID=UPI003891A694